MLVSPRDTKDRRAPIFSFSSSVYLYLTSLQLSLHSSCGTILFFMHLNQTICTCARWADYTLSTEILTRLHSLPLIDDNLHQGSLLYEKSAYFGRPLSVSLLNLMPIVLATAT
jgi:hypothetical protein